MNFKFWQSILEEHWGVKSKLSSLDSEFDLNILVRSTDDNNDYVLKIMREDCHKIFLNQKITRERMRVVLKIQQKALQNNKIFF